MVKQILLEGYRTRVVHDTSVAGERFPYVWEIQEEENGPWKSVSAHSSQSLAVHRSGLDEDDVVYAALAGER